MMKRSAINLPRLFTKDYIMHSRSKRRSNRNPKQSQLINRLALEVLRKCKDLFRNNRPITLKFLQEAKKLSIKNVKVPASIH